MEGRAAVGEEVAGREGDLARAGFVLERMRDQAELLAEVFQNGWRLRELEPRSRVAQDRRRKVLGRLGENRRDRRRLLGVRRDDFGDPIPLHRVLYVRRGEDELDQLRAASEGTAAPIHDLPLVSSILLFVFVLLLAAAAGPEDPQALS